MKLVTTPRETITARLTVTVLVVVSIGCGIPHDPERTMSRAQGGTIRAGITENPPWTTFTNGRAGGIEPQMLLLFAESIDADIEWQVDSETDLLRELKDRDLDVVIGGLTKSTPWSKQVGLTRPYLTLGDDKHVMAVPPGENRWLLELDRFLHSHKSDAIRLLNSEAGQ